MENVVLGEKERGVTMVIIHVVGGFGNQLYCYAMYLLQESLGKEVKLDIRDYLTGADHKEKRRLELLDCVKMKPEIAEAKECYRYLDNAPDFFSKLRRKMTGRKQKCLMETKEFDEAVFTFEEGYLDGYWNCEYYYESIFDKLQKEIVFPKNCGEKNDRLAKEIALSESVAIHLRRTDYLDESCKERYAKICTDAYYEKALAYVRECHQKQKSEKPLKIYIFSDDPAYAKQYFQNCEATFVDFNQGEHSIFDCMLMSNCKYHICANSTFSMWGARLSERQDKVMIRPLKHDNYETFTIEQRHQYWKQWILIDERGNLV